MADPCPDCGKDRVLVGYRHLCVPVSANANVEEASRRSTLAALERHHASRVTPPSRPVTPPSRRVMPATQLTQALTRVAELEEEVKRLKREVAEARGWPHAPMSPAERMRLMRKRKAEKRNG